MAIKISDEAESPTGLKPIKTNTYVSLNMKTRQFYAVDNFVLTADSPTAKVTAEVSKADREIIQKSIDMGFLVQSKIHIPFVDKPVDLIDDLKEKIKSSKNIKELHPHIVPVVSGKIAKDYGARVVLDELLEYEKNSQARARFIEYFEYALNNIPGPGKIIDSIVGKRTIDVGHKTVDVGMRVGAETSPKNKDLI
jgi:hypothetical protein